MSLNDLIKYRHSRAMESLEEARLLANNNHWNAVANRLYYACFYLVTALLLKKNLNFSSHNGVKSEFHKSFVKKNLISLQSGKLYGQLFNLRQEGDYIDFVRLNKDDVFPFFYEVDQFFNELENLIKKDLD
jgi:uncharacterized protein (UPF0332 family)